MIAAAPYTSGSLRLLGYSDQGGRPHGIQIMVRNEHGYIGQAHYGGFSIINGANPRDPRPAAFVATAPSTFNIHLQVHEDLLLVVDGANLFRWGTPRFGAAHPTAPASAGGQLILQLPESWHDFTDWRLTWSARRSSAR